MRFMSGKNKVKYTVCGRYVDAADKRVTLGYSIRCSDSSKSGKYTPDVLGYLCGRGLVTNCTAYVNGMSLAFRGNGIDLSSLPVKYVKNNKRSKIDKGCNNSTEHKYVDNSIDVLSIIKESYTDICGYFVSNGFTLSRVTGNYERYSNSKIDFEFREVGQLGIEAKHRLVLTLITKHGTSDKEALYVKISNNNIEDDTSDCIDVKCLDNKSGTDNIVKDIRALVVRTLRGLIVNSKSCAGISNNYNIGIVKSSGILISLLIAFVEKINRAYSKYRIDSVLIYPVDDSGGYHMRSNVIVGNSQEENMYQVNCRSYLKHNATDAMCDISMYLIMPTNSNRCLAYSSGVIDGSSMVIEDMTDTMVSSIIILPDK